MPSALPGNTSQTARLVVDPPGFAVGWQEPVYLPNPPAGQNWSHQVDGRYYERLVAVTFRLATDAAVAARFPQVVLTDVNGTPVTAVPAGNNVAASTSVTVSLVLTSPGFAVGSSGATFGFLPDLLVPPGWTWQSAAGGLDAGDQFSAVTLLVQRFPNDAAVITAG